MTTLADYIGPENYLSGFCHENNVPEDAILAVDQVNSWTNAGYSLSWKALQLTQKLSSGSEPWLQLVPTAVGLIYHRRATGNDSDNIVSPLCSFCNGPLTLVPNDGLPEGWGVFHCDACNSTEPFLIPGV